MVERIGMVATFAKTKLNGQQSKSLSINDQVASKLSKGIECIE